MYTQEQISYPLIFVSLGILTVGVLYDIFSKIDDLKTRVDRLYYSDKYKKYGAINDTDKK